mgnify:CR=1 FL=1
MQDSKVLAPLPVADWDDSLTQVMEDMHGQPLKVHALMANHPELLKAWWDFRNYVVVGGDLGKRSGELVILRVALHMKSWYEWGSHVDRALACGLTLAEIERVKQPAAAPGWAPADMLLLTAVDELIARHAIAPETLAELYQHYSPKQVMDLIAIQGMYVTLGGMINSFGLELDQQVLERLPESVSQAQFESEFPRS